MNPHLPEAIAIMAEVVALFVVLPAVLIYRVVRGWRDIADQVRTLGIFAAICVAVYGLCAAGSAFNAWFLALPSNTVVVIAVVCAAAIFPVFVRGRA